jgi:tRNA nucleotidyltransferase/poly(A) polymerase
MRAVRFAATMGFALAPETEAAIAGALDVFDRVSRERVRVELMKLLAARAPSRGLEPMAATGLWERVLPSLGEEVRVETIEAVDRLPPRPVLRLARLLWPVRSEQALLEATLEKLRPSREERTRVLRATCELVDELALMLDADADADADAERGPSLRRIIAELDRRHLDDAMAILELDASERQRVEAALEGAALTTKELAIKGRDLIAAKVAAPGPELGELLAALLDWVIDDPSRNESEALLGRARTLAQGA